MEKLLSPDIGLMFWTIVTFLSLVFILKAFAWGPLLKAIDEREARLKADLDGAEESHKKAESLKGDLEAKMQGLEAKGREILEAAGKEGDSLRAKLKSEAESDAAKIREKTKAELGEERERLVRELRKDVAELSLLAAERLVKKTVDAGVQKSVLDDFFKELDKGALKGR